MIRPWTLFAGSGRAAPLGLLAQHGPRAHLHKVPALHTAAFFTSEKRSGQHCALSGVQVKRHEDRLLQHQVAGARLQHKIFDNTVEWAPLVACGLSISPVPSSYLTIKSAWPSAHALMGRAAAHLNSPVISCRKFSAVLGTKSAYSSIFMRPAGMPPIVTSAPQHLHTWSRHLKHRRSRCSTNTAVRTKEDHWVARHRLPQVPLRHLGRHAPAALFLAAALEFLKHTVEIPGQASDKEQELSVRCRALRSRDATATQEPDTPETALESNRD